MCSGVSLQVERVVETFAAERAQVPFDIAVTFHVSVQQTLQIERLRAQVAAEFRTVFGVSLGRLGSVGVDRHDGRG